MIIDNDTLPYKETMEIHKDTEYTVYSTIYPGDTTYSVPCACFERINGKIMNLTDDNCLQQGFWIIKDTTGDYMTGIYKNGLETGIWKYYKRNGKLKRIVEKLILEDESIDIKEIDFSTGHAVTTKNKTFLAFYIKYYSAIWYLFIGIFIIRVFINSRIYNIEFDTNYSPIYFYIPFFTTKNFYHSIICTFTFWFFNYKTENRRLVIISNTLSLIAFSIIITLIVGFLITGEIQIH